MVTVYDKSMPPSHRSSSISPRSSPRRLANISSHRYGIVDNCASSPTRPVLDGAAAKCNPIPVLPNLVVPVDATRTCHSYPMAHIVDPFYFYHNNPPWATASSLWLYTGRWWRSLTWTPSRGFPKHWSDWTAIGNLESKWSHLFGTHPRPQCRRMYIHVRFHHPSRVKRER
jgi:hypothetical protein